MTIRGRGGATGARALEAFPRRERSNARTGGRIDHEARRGNERSIVSPLASIGERLNLHGSDVDAVFDLPDSRLPPRGSQVTELETRTGRAVLTRARLPLRRRNVRSGSCSSALTAGVSRANGHSPSPTRRRPERPEPTVKTALALAPRRWFRPLSSAEPRRANRHRTCRGSVVLIGASASDRRHAAHPP